MYVINRHKNRIVLKKILKEKKVLVYLAFTIVFDIIMVYIAYRLLNIEDNLDILGPKYSTVIVISIILIAVTNFTVLWLVITDIYINELRKNLIFSAKLYELVASVKRNFSILEYEKAYLIVDEIKGTIDKEINEEFRYKAGSFFNSPI